MQEQIAEGSLKNSHRNTNPVFLKRANTFLQKKALDYLYTKCQDLVISQRLNPDTNILEKNTFFVHSYTAKTEPGFLVCMPNTTPIFIKTSNKKDIQPHAFILRFRFSQEVHNGSIFIVSLDTINHTFLFEDIYVWNDHNIFINKTFTQRRSIMKKFIEYHYIADVRLLGGLITSVLNPKSLDYFEELKDTKNYTRVHFIPDSPNRRRLTYTLNDIEARINDGYYGRKEISSSNLPVPVLHNPILSKAISAKPVTERPTIAKAVALPMLPDVYELYDNSISLGKAAIQTLELSKKLKEVIDDNKYVKIKYNDNFKRYEIIDLHLP
jgi:hypothetical protein